MIFPVSVIWRPALASLSVGVRRHRREPARAALVWSSALTEPVEFVPIGLLSAGFTSDLDLGQQLALAPHAMPLHFPHTIPSDLIDTQYLSEYI
jgi:hypothetical protein